MTELSYTLFFRSQWGLRTFVHINLCCTLFILGVDKTSNDVSNKNDYNLAVEFWYIQVVCATVAILLQYFFLTSFMWMLMEGIVLYIVLVKVFTQVNWKYYISFTLLSYGKTACANNYTYVSMICSYSGSPLLYMGVCVPLGLVRTDEWSYGNDDLLVVFILY